MEIAYLDLDGVGVNFTQGACKMFNVEYPANTTFFYDWICVKHGISRAKFWSTIVGAEFWENLEPYPWTRDLVDILESSKVQWRFLSKPTYDAGCYAGKYNWVKKHFGKHINKLILINGDKSIVCRGSKSLLIDDKDKNIEQWQAAGGSVFHWEEVSPDVDVADRLLAIRRLLKT